ncbi:MAG: hypothetical protein FWF85_03690 [Clostridiales bacterium]|nr:hypothetical protein [Clostridiales bacterium]
MGDTANRQIEAYLDVNLDKLENFFHSDVISFYGPLVRGIDDLFKHYIEDIRDNPKSKRRTKHLAVILTTPGGSAEVVERIVGVIRHHYELVSFIVPDCAYSAGTILCMSGDNIYMDYYSVLGPIDPQVENKEGKLVPALGYLDKVKEMITKAQNGVLTDAEFLILKDMDLAELRAYEQAQELTVDLLKKWLVKYKFKIGIIIVVQGILLLMKKRKNGLKISLRNWEKHLFGARMLVR